MKTNRFLVAAGISLAMALTVSCSDDDDNGAVSSGSLKACFYQLPEQHGMPDGYKSGSFCQQIDVEFPKEGCNGSKGGKLRESCPSNPDETCPMKIEGYDVDVFLYGYAAMRSCEAWESDFSE